MACKKTYFWIKKQVEEQQRLGNKEDFSKSTIVKQNADMLDDFNFDV